MQAKQVTIKEVAHRAGTSIRTVSRVLNDQGEISEATRSRVKQVISELGYRPSLLARGLVQGKTFLVALIVPDITDPFFPELILGAEKAANEKGYSVLLANASRDIELEKHYVELFYRRRVDGLLIAGSRLDAEELRSVVAKHRVVALTINAIPEATCMHIDDLGGTYAICKYLISLGHRRIGFLEGTWAKSAQYRFQGFLRALGERQLAPADKCIVSVEPNSVEMAKSVAAELLDRQPDLTALVCYNDMLAIGVLQACKEKRLRVPQDLSVTGFDDIPEASRTDPPLTTMRVDRHVLGMTMMNKLIAMIEGTAEPGELMRVQAKLIERASCASPRNT
jgi:LacI family transcriptional regulator